MIDFFLVSGPLLCFDDKRKFQRSGSRENLLFYIMLVKALTLHVIVFYTMTKKVQFIQPAIVRHL